MTGVAERSTGLAIRLRRIDLANPSAGTARDAEAAGLLGRRAVPTDPAIRSAVTDVLADVRARGDEAVRDANRRFGGGLAGDRLVLGRPELERAAEDLDAPVRAALDQAIEHVEQFATTQRPALERTTIADGIEIERRWVALDRVGCYVPGGSAPYPSSLVMTVVPARVAGVASIVVASPASRDGAIDPVLLGVAGLLGVDELVVAGGAQAIGALAFGLPDAGLAPVDRIVGPGNAWVTAAKHEVSGEVAIDLPAGPSEGMVLADAAADPITVAADLVTQAEHGPDSPAILVTTSRELADLVDAQIGALVGTLERRDVIARSLANHGWIVLAPDLAAAIDVVNTYAPEHLSVDVDDLEAAVAAIRHAGSVFVGRWAPESAGDYATGANHVLPTGGLARAHGPLGVEAYGHHVQVQRLTRAGLAGIRRTVSTLATAEGLTAHRNAIEARFRDDVPGRRAAASATVSPAPSVAAPRPRAPSIYAWEATDEAIAARYGVPLAQIVRFDLNTSPEPPAVAAATLARGGFRPTLSEYPPSDYRPLVGAAASAYGVQPDEILVAAGADEVLDIVAKAFLPPRGVAVIPAPTYGLYQVLTEQRGAHAVVVPRRPPQEQWALDLAATVDAAGGADVVWVCNPNNPTATAEPDGAIESLLASLASGAGRLGRRPPIVVLDEAYAEFTGRTQVTLRERSPNLVVVRTASKAYGLAGLRVGFAVADPATIAELARYRPPASVSTTSAAVVTDALRDPAAMLETVAAVERERGRLIAGLRELGWAVGPSVTNFVLVDLGSPVRAGAVAATLLRRGIVPRTFDAGHPLAGFLRFTVRDAPGNDRLVEAAREATR